jgi:hypothetical protein
MLAGIAAACLVLRPISGAPALAATQELQQEQEVDPAYEAEMRIQESKSMVRRDTLHAH